MVHGYHAVFGAYGMWLPNDPRGSWSDFVGAWELVRFGRATKSIERKDLAGLTASQRRTRRLAIQSLKYPPVRFTGVQARAIGRGFAAAAGKSGLTIWACSILPEHVHLVLARHRLSVEQMVILLKGAATRELGEEDLNPPACSPPADGRGRPRGPWSRGTWRAYLDTVEAIEGAIRYVEENPTKEGQPLQRWSFVTPFRGLDEGWVTYHG